PPEPALFCPPPPPSLACEAVTVHVALRTSGHAELAPSRSAKRSSQTRRRRVEATRHSDGEPDREPAPEPPRRSSWRTALAGAESLAMVAGAAAAAAILVGAWESTARDVRTVPGLTLAGVDIGNLTREDVEAAAAAATEQTLDRSLTLSAGPVSTTSTARALGAVPRPEAVVEQALAYGHSGDLIADLQARARARAGSVDLRVGMRFDERKALEQLLELGPAVDTMSLPTRLDLEARKVLPATRG